LTENEKFLKNFSQRRGGAKNAKRGEKKEKRKKKKGIESKEQRA